MHNCCLDLILFTIEELNIPGLSFENKLFYLTEFYRSKTLMRYAHIYIDRIYANHESNYGRNVFLKRSKPVFRS